LLALAMLLAAGCTDTPEEPEANTEPNTFITSYIIGISPDSGSYYATTVYWRAADPDGQALRFNYWLDDDGGTQIIPHPDSGDYITTFETSVNLSVEFPTGAEVYTFYVQTQDNQGALDPTEAQTEISITAVRSIGEFKPDTRIVTGPGNGSLTGTGINVTFAGSDVDGYIASFEYILDTDTMWSSVANDLIAGSATLNILDIPTGARTLEVRAIDNFGQIDPSPLSVSFLVVDTLYPDLYVTSGAIEGAFFFLPAGGTETDIQTGWDGDAAWYFSTVDFRYRTDGGTWSGWQAENSALLEGLGAGAHILDVEARDLSGNITPYTTNFGVGSLIGDRGVLVMNGIHFGTYGDEAFDFWTGFTILTTFDADFWDAFGGQDYTNTPELPTRLVDTGAVPGDSLGNYSSFVMIMNGFNGDQEIYDSMLPLLASYLNAGGNILLTGRQGSGFITGGVEDYAQVEYGETLVSISGLTSAVEGIVDMTGAGISRTDLPVIPTSPDVTVLLTVPDFPDNIGGFVTEPESGGKFAHIAGRQYRFDIGPVNTNYEFILTNYFGE
jgi:hypothetical protein